MADPTEPETRFAFGENWSTFLKQMDAGRIEQATESLRRLFALDCPPRDVSTCDASALPAGDFRPLAGKRFLDIGSGSGLFSLAAISLGASVVSVDIDRQSFECTRRLRDQWDASIHGSAVESGSGSERGGASSGVGKEFRVRGAVAGAVDGTGQAETQRPDWHVHQLSVLDRDAMCSLGVFDVVYSWGVLHHTGKMREAIGSAADRVAPGGRFAIAIYNDQGGGSRRWYAIKRGYHRVPSVLRPIYVTLVAGVYESKFAAARLARGRNPLPFSDWRAKRNDRGMSVWHDWVDWIGGLPFEVATPEAIIVPLRRQGFVLENLRTVGSGWGCNEYVFSREVERVHWSG